MLHVEEDELPPSWGKADSHTQRAKHASDLAGWHAKQLTAVDGDESERSWCENQKSYSRRFALKKFADEDESLNISVLHILNIKMVWLTKVG